MNIPETKTNMYKAKKGRSIIRSKYHNIIGISILSSIVLFIIIKIYSNERSISHFTQNNDITKLLIGLLLLYNIKNLSTSIIDNIIYPILKPFLPYLSCNIDINLGKFNIKLGKFITDLVIFSLNILILYVIYIIM